MDAALWVHVEAEVGAAHGHGLGCRRRVRRGAEPLGRQAEGIAILKLIPRNEDSGFRYVQIGLEHDSLIGMELSDNFGQLTRIYFNNLKTGVRLDPALFSFRPPAGVDVFEGQ